MTALTSNTIVDTIDIEQRHLKEVRSILARHLPYKDIWAYGSRVKWRASETSDLDCVVFDATDSEIFRAQEALDESQIPIEIQLLNWETIPNHFRENINKKYFVLRKKEDWGEERLEDFAEINPNERLPKGTISKKITMDLLQPFTKKVSGYSIEKYNGGMKFRNGDIIMARITPCLENGKTAFIDILNEHEVGFGSTEFIVLREKIDISDKQFLYYLAMSPGLRNIAILSMVGSSGRQRAQTDAIKQCKFLLPSLPEQKAIAEVLSSLDDKIDLLHRQNKTLETIAQALFRQWFIEEAQDDWEEKPLDEIADYLNGLACQKYPTKNKTDRLPVLKIRELRNGITENTDWVTSKVADKYLINFGDVIFSWSGSLMVKIWNGQRCALNQHLFKVTSKQYPKWFYYFWTKHHLDKFTGIALSKATTMGHIKRDDLSGSLVLVPPNEVLFKMSDKIEPLLEKVLKNYKQVRALTNLRDTLLPKLMNGEVVIDYGEEQIDDQCRIN